MLNFFWPKTYPPTHAITTPTQSMIRSNSGLSGHSSHFPSIRKWVPTEQSAHLVAPRHVQIPTFVPFGPGWPCKQNEQSSGRDSVHSRDGSGSQSRSVLHRLPAPPVVSSISWRFAWHCCKVHWYADSHVLFPRHDSFGVHGMRSGQWSRTIASLYWSRSHRFGWQRPPVLARL